MMSTNSALAARRTTRSAKEELTALLDSHDPPISRNKLSQKLEISLAHVSRACAAHRRDQFSGEALGRIALLLGLPEDYFPEYRRDYIIRRLESDGELRDRIYDQVASDVPEEAVVGPVGLS